MNIPYGDRHDDESWEITGHREHIHGVSREDIVKELGRSGMHREANRLSSCGSKYFVHQCENCDTVDISGSRCDFRICPECGEKRIMKLIAQESEFLRNLPTNPRGQSRASHLILTLKNVEDKDYRRYVYPKFREYIRRFFDHPEIRPHIRGGIRSIETKHLIKGKVYHRRDGRAFVGDGSWNLHMHALVDMDFIHKFKVSRIWKEVTGDSYIVEVKAKRNGIAALVEVIKYVLKPPNLGDAKSYARYLKVTKGLRLLSTFGTWRKEGRMKISAKGTKRCPTCKSQMAYLFRITPKEALRWREYLKGPPAPDLKGYYPAMGLPRTLNAVLGHPFGTGHIGVIKITPG